MKRQDSDMKDSGVAQNRKALSANGLVPELSNGLRHFGLLFAFLIRHLFPSNERMGAHHFQGLYPRAGMTFTCIEHLICAHH